MTTDRLHESIFSHRKNVLVPPSTFVQLLKFEDNSMVFNPEGLKVIELTTLPIGVAVIGGPGSTGRTGLLNLLIGKPELEEGLQDRDSGLWIYSEAVCSGDHEILVVDVEGFGESELDLQLMVVLYVLSSVFIFNSRGFIDEPSMQRFKVLNHLTSLLDLPRNHPEETLRSMAPYFIWTLRDFGPKLMDEEGVTLRGKEYLQGVLESAIVQSADYIAQFNHTRQSLLNIFQQRDCVCFPADSSDPKFRVQLEYLKQVAFLQCPPKSFFGQTVNGPLLSSMLQLTVRDINTSTRPDLSRNWRLVKEIELSALLDEVKQNYLSVRVVDLKAMPYNEYDLLVALDQARQEAMLVLRKSITQDKELEATLNEELDCFFEIDSKFYLEANLMASDAFNRALLQRVFRGISDRMSDGFYACNFAQLDHDFKQAMQSYHAASRGPGDFEAFLEFNSKFMTEGFECLGNSTKYQEELSSLQSECKGLLEDQTRLDEQVRSVVEEETHWTQLVQQMESMLNFEHYPLHLDKRVEAIINRVRERRLYKKQVEERYSAIEQSIEHEQDSLSYALPTPKPRRRCCKVF
jgi:hypothetical protein